MNQGRRLYCSLAADYTAGGTNDVSYFCCVVRHGIQIFLSTPPPTIKNACYGNAKGLCDSYFDDLLRVKVFFLRVFADCILVSCYLCLHFVMNVPFSKKTLYIP
jgi:hypothetical protein